MSKLDISLKNARDNGFILGVKLVRGAYLKQEERDGFSQLLWSDKAQTDEAYNEAVTQCIHHVDKLSVCVATHNRDSVALCLSLLEEQGVPVDHPHVSTAQLLGMNDVLSFNAAQCGLKTYKYVPYGPTDALLPYLLRRLQENTDMLNGTRLEWWLRIRSLVSDN